MSKKRVSGLLVTGKGPLHATVNIVYGNDPKPAMEPGDIYTTLKSYREKAFAILPEYKSPHLCTPIEFDAMMVVAHAQSVEAALESNDAPQAALIAMHLHDAMLRIRIRDEKKVGGDTKANKTTPSDFAYAYGKEFVYNNEDAGVSDGVKHVMQRLNENNMYLAKGTIQKRISPLFPEQKRRGGRPRKT